MIDQVRFETAESSDGKPYERAMLWIAGVPFCADLTPQTERMCRRIARDAGLEVTDVRRS